MLNIVSQNHEQARIIHRDSKSRCEAWLSRLAITTLLRYARSHTPRRPFTDTHRVCFDHFRPLRELQRGQSFAEAILHRGNRRNDERLGVAADRVLLARTPHNTTNNINKRWYTTLVKM